MHEFLEHLKEDHEKQKKLGKQLYSTADPDTRNRLRKEFYVELYPHIIGEEASMFKRLKDSENEEIRDDSMEGLQEHHVSKIVLRELMEIETGGDLFKAKAKVLDELNRHHIEEEEEDVFKHLQNVCSTEELSELFEAYETAEENAKKE